MSSKKLRGRVERLKAPKVHVSPQMRERIDAIKWFHSIDPGDGKPTPGFKAAGTLAREAKAVFDFDVQGKSVLDIGAWDGFFSFEAHRRGASRVLATDHYCWSGEGWGTKDGFDLINEHLGYPVASLDIDPMNISPDGVGEFDVVLFLGVLYHLRHPLLGLERAAACARERLVVETLIHEHDTDEPSMVFYPDARTGNDPTNWWGPNEACVEEMLKSLGFSEIRVRTTRKSDRGRVRLGRRRRKHHRAVFQATR